MSYLVRIAILFASVLTTLCLLNGASVSAQNTTDPSLYCSVFTFQPYSVVVVGSTGDTLGSPLSSQVSTFYNQNTYYVTLSTQVTNNHLFLELNNSINGNVTFSVQWGLYDSATNTIVANNYILDPLTGLAKIYSFNQSGWEVELTPFTSGGVLGRTYVVTVNLTQNIYGPTGLNGVIARIDGCYYVDYFFITNPGSSSGSTAGFGVGSGSSSGGSSSTGSAIIGDPTFVGLRGQVFQVHGIDGAIYNLISDLEMQLNSRFAFLNGPRECPIMPSTNKRSSFCWSHAGSYLSELGLKTADGERVFIASGNAEDGFSQVTVNGHAMEVGTSEVLHVANSLGRITFNSTHEITFSAGHFIITVENIDGFFNLRSVRVVNWRSLSSHGLLGQTWSSAKYSGPVKEIEGEVDDYVVVSDSIFGDEFVFNRFNVQLA